MSYYHDNTRRNRITKFNLKNQKIKYVWRKKIHRNTNLSKFEKLPYDILTYMSQFLNIIDITIFPTLSQSLYDDFKLNYFKNSQSELYLRFGYGYSILDYLFLFSKMNFNKDDSLLKKCLDDNKLLNEFIIIINQITKYLIKEQRFTEDKIILFINFMLELNVRNNNEKKKEMIISNLLNIIVQLTSFLERHYIFLSTIFHKCIDFLNSPHNDGKKIGINGILNLIQNSKSHIRIEDYLIREITYHWVELSDLIPCYELQIIIYFYLEVTERDNNKFR